MPCSVAAAQTVQWSQQRDRQVWGPQPVSSACQTDRFTAHISDLLLRCPPRRELASSSAALLWSLFEFEIFVLKTVLPKGQHHILLQGGSARLEHQGGTPLQRCTALLLQSSMHWPLILNAFEKKIIKLNTDLNEALGCFF